MAEKFSTGLDQIDVIDQEIQTRRIAVYSPEALQKAARVEKVYIHHTGFSQVMKAMDRLFQMAGEFDMPQGMLLQGPTGVGKTSVFKYFCQSLPSSNLFSPGLGAVGIRSSMRPSVGYLIRSLLWAYRYPFTKGSDAHLYARRGLLIDLIRQKRTRLLFIDEASGLLTKGVHRSEDRHETDVSDLLREIVDECKLSLVCASVTGGDAIDRLDPALASRVSVRLKLDDFAADAQWLGFLRAYAKQCDAFDLAIFADNTVAKLLHMATGGNLREFKRLMTEAVLVAVDASRSSVCVEDLARSFGLIYGSACEKENVFQ
jgi:Bacterial TniB protein